MIIVPPPDSWEPEPRHGAKLYIPQDFDEPSVDGEVETDDAFLQELLDAMAKPVPLEFWPKPGPCTRRLRALGGFFWLPCPACGQMFAGYEAGEMALDGRICCSAHDPVYPVWLL